MIIRKRLGYRLAAAAVAAMAATTATVASPAHATTTHQIQIDGAPLFSRYIVIVGLGTWMDANQVQTVTLNEDQHYQIRAGATAASFTFWADSSGHVQYDGTDAESFLDGAGTGRLTLVGVDANIDSRYLSGAGVLLADVPADNADWLRNQTVRLLPSATYRWQQSGGVVADLNVALHADGTWSYDSQFAGYMAGTGTSTLTFYGYPLLVDARASGGTGLLVQPLKGVTFTYTAVQSLVLLPAHPFWLQIRSGEVTDVSFALDNTGAVTFDPGEPLAVDSFNGLKRLTVTGPIG